MLQKSLSLILSLCLLAALAVACSTESSATELSGKTWELVSMKIDGQPYPLLEDRVVSLSFDFETGNLNGSAGCNQYFAGFEVKNEKLILSMPGATEMFCFPDTLMTQEYTYLQALGTVETFFIENESLTLTLSNAGELIFK